VDIFDDNGVCLYSFCAFDSPGHLDSLWFAVERDRPPPEKVYVVLRDRKLNREYKSNLIALSEAVAERVPPRPAFEKEEPPARPRREEAGVPPEVEKALRAAGWTAIKGTWKLVEKNVYEVTDGKLEAQKTNGIVFVVIRDGATGSVSLFVRRSFEDYSSSEDGTLPDRAPGYGFTIRRRSYGIYTPWSSPYLSNDWRPYKGQGGVLAEAPRHAFSVQAVTDPKGATELIYFLDGKRSKACKYQVPLEGPMVLTVSGTAVIETPTAQGQ
jgi:hypothetical protein